MLYDSRTWQIINDPTSNTGICWPFAIFRSTFPAWQAPSLSNSPHFACESVALRSEFEGAADRRLIQL